MPRAPAIKKELRVPTLAAKDAAGMGHPAESAPNPQVLAVADRLHSTAIHLLRRLRKQDVKTGEGPARLSALSVLVFGGPKTLGQLAAAERVKPPTMSRIVAGLKQSGLAKVQNDGQDARRITISVTAKGERLLQEARKRRIQVLAENLKNLSGADLKTLSKASNLIEKM